MKRICSTCKRELDLETHFNKNGWSNGKQRWRYDCKDCFNAKHRKRYAERKVSVFDIMLETFGKIECSSCGYDKCFEALDLHHRDPSKKDKNISSMKLYSENKIRAEIEKCDLLCANCHRELHANGK